MSQARPYLSQKLQSLHGPFGADALDGRLRHLPGSLERRGFLIGQTIVVVGWIALNVVGAFHRWDPYPFILLNLAFSFQAAYAAPLILLAQTRQADRDKAMSETDADHREALAQAAVRREEIAHQEIARLRVLLEANTALTEQVERLTEQIHLRVIGAGGTGVIPPPPVGI